MIRPLATFIHVLDAARTAGTLARTVLVLSRQLDNAHLLAASEGARADRAELRVAELEAALQDWREASGELACEQPARSLEERADIARRAWDESPPADPGPVEWDELPLAGQAAWCAVVRAVDASRPAAPEVDAEDLWADYRTERPHMTIADRVAFLAGVEAGRRTSDASRPGLTEEQAQIARAEPVIAAWLDYFAAMDRQHKSGTAADARTVRELRAKVEAMSPSVTDIVYFVALARHRARGEVGPAPAGEERPAKPCPAFFGLAGSVYGAQFGDRCDACRRTRAEHGASQ